MKTYYVTVILTGNADAILCCRTRATTMVICRRVRSSARPFRVDSSRPTIRSRRKTPAGERERDRPKGSVSWPGQQPQWSALGRCGKGPRAQSG